MYHEPLVKMRFKSIDRSTQLEAIVSKDRLCSSSRVFDKMLNGKFKEAIEQTIELEELPNVVTRETFVGFIRWLYERNLAFDPSISPQESLRGYRTGTFRGYVPHRRP